MQNYFILLLKQHISFRNSCKIRRSANISLTHHCGDNDSILKTFVLQARFGAVGLTLRPSLLCSKTKSGLDGHEIFIIPIAH